MTTPSTTSISFNWNSDSTISKVYIYWNGIYVGASITNAFNNTGLVANTTYNYDIVSVHSNGNLSYVPKQVSTSPL